MAGDGPPQGGRQPQGTSADRAAALLLTGRAIVDLIESEAMGAVVGPAGLGKTFAIDALAGREEQIAARSSAASAPASFAGDYADVRGQADDAAGRRPAARRHDRCARERHEVRGR